MRDKEVDKFLAEHLFFPSKVLITTRHMWPHEAHVITLTGLNQGQTRQMLEDIGRSQGVNQSFSGQDIHLIHSATAGNPYAVRLIIGQLSKKIPLKNTLESLQDFSGYSEGHIGEKLDIPDAPVLKKVISDVGDVVENLEEVLDHFRGTPYEKYTHSLCNQ